MLCRFGRSELSRPVRATVWLNVAWIRPSAATSAEQPLAVRAAQLLDLAVLQQRADELRPLVAQLLQRRRVGRGSGLGLLDRRQAAPGRRRGVEQLAQLDRRVDVEVVAPDDLLQLGAEADDVGGEPLVEAAQLGTVDGDAGVLHAGQDTHQRVLDRAVQLGHPLLVEAAHQWLDEVVHGERLSAGRRRRVGLGAVEVELTLGRRLVGRRGEPGVALDEVRQLVAGLGRIEQVGGDRRVQLEPIELDAELQQRAHQRLGVVAADRGCGQGDGDGRIVEVGGRHPRHGGGVGVGDDGEPAQRATTGLAVPRGGDVEASSEPNSCAVAAGDSLSVTSATSC